VISVGKGAKVFLRGEWNGSVRSAAVFHARKLGCTPQVNIRNGVLFVWPADFDPSDKALVLSLVGLLEGRGVASLRSA
jgi:hypothetical protein